MSDIIAIGGGGFLAEPRNLALEKVHPRSDRQRAAERADDSDGAGRRRGVRGEVSRGVRRARRDDRGLAVLSSDAGSAGAHSRAGCDLCRRRQYEEHAGGVARMGAAARCSKRRTRAGIVLGGQSAGAICWFEQGITDSWADRLRPLDCMGFLPGSCCPHYDGEVERRPAYHACAERGLKPGYAIEDARGRALQERPPRARRVEEGRAPRHITCRSTRDGERTRARRDAAAGA